MAVQTQVCCVKGCGEWIAEYNFCAVHMHFSDVYVKTAAGQVVDKITIKKDNASRKIVYNDSNYEMQIDNTGLFIVIDDVDPVFQGYLNNLKQGFQI